MQRQAHLIRPEDARWSQRREGYSLIQVLVVITTATTLLMTGATILATMLRAQATAQEHFRQTRLRSRLTRVFTEDVHAARTAVWDPAQSLLTLTAGDWESTWQVQGPGLLRISALSGTKTGQEAFTLQETAVRFEPVPAGKPAHVRLVLDTGKREFVIVARLGRDLRFVSGDAP